MGQRAWRTSQAATKSTPTCCITQKFPKYHDNRCVRVHRAPHAADPADVTLQQLRGFMNIEEGGEGTGGAAAAATAPTPPVHPDHDDGYLMEGGEAACVRGWERGGYVALANFNQVQHPPCFLHSSRFLIAISLSALQDHACMCAHVVWRNVEAAALLPHAAQGLLVCLCSCVAESSCLYAHAVCSAVPVQP